VRQTLEVILIPDNINDIFIEKNDGEQYNRLDKMNEYYEAGLGDKKSKFTFLKVSLYSSCL
jgi:hypothetical protein